MVVMNRESLSETLDAVNQAFFDGKVLTEVERSRAANWIAGLQGKPRSYFGLFAPASNDRIGAVRVFSGEPINSNVGISHILGEEACRALRLLKVTNPEVKAALKRANDEFLKRLREYETQYKVHGMYCCGICSASFWRNIVAGGLDKREQRLAAGMIKLKKYRLGNGEWRRFPFFYTLLALNDIELKSALDEMRYAAPVLERYLKRAKISSKYSQRRHDLAERILARC